jgi:hypothetical protein
MKGENLIHVKLEYEEAVQGKKDVLATEVNLLRLIRTIKRYHALRIEELKLEAKAYKNISEMNLNIKKELTILPEVHLPKILKQQEVEEKPEKKIKKIEKVNYDDDIESQLRDIQNSLRELS